MNSMLTLAADPLSQVVNQAWYSVDGYWVWSAHVGNLLIAAVLTLLVITYTAGKVSLGPESLGTRRFMPRSRFAHLIEVLIVYLRDNMVQPLLGKRTNRFLPFILTMFFFILINNLLGLIPISKALWLVFPAWKAEHVLPVGMTATQNIYVTAGLAVIAFIVINLAGIRELGIGGYLKHLTAETPVVLWPLMIPIEIASTFIKPIALAIRLFANMTAGHILMVVLYGFAAMGIGLLVEGEAGLKAVGGLVSVASIVGALGIYMLELLVALIQAFVFCFLTCVFIAQLEHHHEHGHDDAHHGHEHAHA